MTGAIRGLPRFRQPRFYPKVFAILCAIASAPSARAQIAPVVTPKVIPAGDAQTDPAAPTFLLAKPDPDQKPPAADKSKTKPPAQPTSSFTVDYVPKRNDTTGIFTVTNGTLSGTPLVEIKCTILDPKLHPPAIAVALHYKYQSVSRTFQVATKEAPILLQDGVYKLDLTKFASSLISTVNGLLPPNFTAATPLALDSGGAVEVKVTPVISFNPLLPKPNNVPVTGEEVKLKEKLTVQLKAH